MSYLELLLSITTLLTVACSQWIVGSGTQRYRVPQDSFSRLFIGTHRASIQSELDLKVNFWVDNLL